MKATIGQSIRERVLSLAFRFVKRAANSPVMWYSMTNGNFQWVITNYRAYANDGYALNPILHAAIAYKMRAATQARMRAYNGDPDSPDILNTSHQLSKIAVRPNPWQSWRALNQGIILYLNLSGNAFIWKEMKGSPYYPKSLYLLRPDRVRLLPNPDDNTILGYRYVPEGWSEEDGLNIPASDMYHIKLPNPLDPYEGLGMGMSPIMPIAQTADVDNLVTKFLKILFERGGLPIGLLSFEQSLTEETIGEVKESWRRQYGGVDNWSDIGVVYNGAKFQRVGMTFEELGFEAIDDRNESRILGPLGVPPILIGTRFGLARSTYNNFKEARTLFWEDTMLFELYLQESEFELKTDNPDGAFLRYDVSEVPALRRDILQQAQAARQLIETGVPPNEAYSIVGLNVPEYEAGHRSYLVSSLIPAEQAGQAQQNLLNGGQQNDQEDEEDPQAGGEAQRAFPFRHSRDDSTIRNFQKRRARLSLPG